MFSCTVYLLLRIYFSLNLVLCFPITVMLSLETHKACHVGCLWPPCAVMVLTAILQYCIWGHRYIYAISMRWSSLILLWQTKLKVSFIDNNETERRGCVLQYDGFCHIKLFFRSSNLLLSISPPSHLLITSWNSGKHKLNLENEVISKVISW